MARLTVEWKLRGSWTIYGDKDNTSRYHKGGLKVVNDAGLGSFEESAYDCYVSVTSEVFPYHTKLGY